MREIKFKFWSPSLGKMFYDYRLNAIDYSTVMGHWKSAEPDLPSSIYAKNFPHLFDAVKLQYIGRKDKNGTEIFEGDIVEDLDLPTSRWEVYYDDKNAWFWCKNEQTSEGVLGQSNASDDPEYPSWGRYKVIGNIYENPELLVKEETQ